MKKGAITIVVAVAVTTMTVGRTSFAASTVPLDQTTAAPAPSDQGASNTPDTTNDEVIITARKRRHTKAFKSGQSIKTMDQDQIRAAGAVGGVASAIAMVPGVSVQSYGNTGSQKSSLSINGIKAGWGGFTTSLDNGSVGVTFDGVPMVNPGNGLWQATLIPQSALLQTMAVTYGPGEVKDRWYTNIGGSLDFVPMQPSAVSGSQAAVTVGSDNARNAYVSTQTGKHDDWETVLFAGGNSSGSFMKGPDGFDQPSHNYAFYAKTRKLLDNGDVSFGAYAADSGAYRPLPTPVSPIPGVGVNGYNSSGTNLGGTPFSEQTSGFYTTLAQNVNFKYDSNQIQMLWSKFNLATSADTTFHNMVYFNREERLHWTPLHDYAWSTSDTSKNETNNPVSDVIGDKMWQDFTLPHNVVSVGGYLQYGYYHSQEQLYSSLPGIGPNNPDGNYYSDLWTQFDTALFTQDTYSPVADLHVTPGIRLVNYAVQFTHDEAAVFPGATGTNLSQYPAVNKNFTKLEPAIDVNWQALPWLAPFASYSMTYRQPENGGGVGPYVTLNPSQVALERGDDYQAGLKMHSDRLGSLSDVSATIAYSHLVFGNETLATALPSGGGLLAFGKSVYDSLNVYADADVYRHMYAFFNLGTVKARFTNYSNSNGSFTDVNVANTPDVNFDVGAYDVMYLRNGMLVKPRLTYVYTGSQYMFDNGQNITSSQKIPSYGIFNASTEWDVPENGKLLKVTLAVDNLLNKEYNSAEYISSGGTYGAGAGSVLALPGAPRMIYLTIGADF